MKKFHLILVMALLLINLTGCAQFLEALCATSATSQQQTQQQDYSIDESIKYEDDGFIWIKLSQWHRQDKHTYYGAKDENGKVIIPVSRKYTSLFYSRGGFYVENDNGEGICDRYGKVMYKPQDGSEYLLSSDGIIKKKNSRGDWEKTSGRIDSDDGHGYFVGSSSTYPNMGYGNPYYGNPYGGSVPAYPNNSGSSYSPSTGNSSSGTLNQTVGEYCQSCHGTGKCHACNGTKVAHGMGNSYTCTLCDSNGNCPVCHGTGKANWNR